MKYNKIIVTGSIAFDEIMDFPGSFSDHIMPDKIHTLNVSFNIDTLEKQIGGTATNIAYATNLLVPEQVFIAGAIGQDGQILIDWFNTHGLSTELIKMDRRLFTSTGKAITDNKDNQIWGFYFGAAITASTISVKKYLTKSTILVISANHPDSMRNFLSQAVEKKTTFMFDPGMSLTSLDKKSLVNGVKNAQWIIGNDYEISRLETITGYSVSKLVSLGKEVVVTLGEKGVNYFSKTTSLFCPAYKISKVVDPTGAGDAWRGGFLGAVMQEKTIAEALQFGNASASFTVERYGTVNHRPKLKDIQQRASSLVVKKL